MKTLRKLGIGGKSLNLIKAIYEDRRANIILSVEGLNASFPKIRSKTRLSALTMSFNIVLIASAIR